MEGPYGGFEAAEGANKDSGLVLAGKPETIVLVAGGVGITPLCSLLQRLAGGGGGGGGGGAHIKTVHLWWTSRSAASMAELSTALPLSEAALALDGKIKITLFDTGKVSRGNGRGAVFDAWSGGGDAEEGGAGEMDQLRRRDAAITTAAATATGGLVDAATFEAALVQPKRCRPDFDLLFRQLRAAEAESETAGARPAAAAAAVGPAAVVAVPVFVCGPIPMARAVLKAAISSPGGGASAMRFDVRVERFEY